MSNTPTLIVIHGLSTTGKTTVGKEIAKRLNVPFLSKDRFEEMMFDHFTVPNSKKWRENCDRVGYDLLWHVAELILKSGSSCLIETKFHDEDASKILNLKRKYKLKLVQLFFEADRSILSDRFRKRALSDRHPVHGDIEDLEDRVKRLSKAVSKPLKLGCKTIKINTSDLSKIDINCIISKINE